MTLETTAPDWMVTSAPRSGTTRATQIPPPDASQLSHSRGRAAAGSREVALRAVPGSHPKEPREEEEPERRSSTMVRPAEDQGLGLQKEQAEGHQSPRRVTRAGACARPPRRVLIPL